ncbi:MAG: PorT family protein [Bacteroidetes bacterium]|nr:PorT family protein [Bacteroidota bacterium]
MKEHLQKGLILGMIFLAGNSYGQIEGTESEKIKDAKVIEKTYLDLVLNVVGTNLNYGKSNSALTDYKKSVLGAQVGVSFQAGITPKLSLVSELYFIMKGGELKANNPLTTYNTNIRLYTFEFPVLARVHFGEFHLNAGPSIAYNIYGSQKIENSTSDLTFNNSAENFKRWEAGVQMGGGYTFHTKRKRVALDIRYNYGLTNIANRGEMYNRSLIVALHFSKPWKTNPLGRK